MSTSTLADEWVYTPPGVRGPRQQRVLALAAALFVVVAASGFVLLRSPAPAEAVVFRYAFDLGQKRTYDLSMEMNVVPSGMPGSEPFDGKVAATLDLEVVETQEDGSATVEMGIGNIRVEPNAGAVPTDLGRLRIRVAPDGRVASVEGVGGLLGITGVTGGSVMSAPGGASSDTASSQFLFPQYPSDAVKPGDSWQHNTKVPFPFGNDEVSIDAEGRLDGYEGSRYGEVARVSHSVSSPLDISFDFAEMVEAIAAIAGQAGLPGGAPPGIENARITIKGSSVMDAVSLVIPGTSDLVRLDGTGKVAMRMAFEGVPNSPEAFVFDATMKMSILRIDAGT